jgi:hypothetical protein
MYEQGMTRSQVLHTIYGVDLPLESVLFFRDVVRSGSDPPPLEGAWRTLPWELMVPLEVGGPTFDLSPQEVASEIRAYAQAPHVLLLGTTGYNHARHGASLIGYDLDELRAGRTTVVGIHHSYEIPASSADFAVLGTSLVDVYHELISRYCVQIRDSLAASRGSPFDHEELDELGEQLAFVEKLRREIAETSGTSR